MIAEEREGAQFKMELPVFKKGIYLFLFYQCIFFTTRIGPDILMNVIENCIIFFVRQLEFCLIFILSKNKGIQYGALLKTST